MIKQTSFIKPYYFLVLFFIPFYSSAKQTVSYPDDLKKPSFRIDKSNKAKYQDQRIKHIILHYTVSNLTGALRTLKDGDLRHQVSSHYLVPKAPVNKRKKIYNLVDEQLRAWHAGVSSWKKRTDLNDTSIGIEIVNFGFTNEHPDGQTRWFPYPEYQIQAIVELVKSIIIKYDIEPTSILGHSDIAPDRKSDPGPLFPWEYLAKQGIGAWYDKGRMEEIKHELTQAGSIHISELQADLKKYGYKIEETGEFDKQTREVIIAFQMHFRPQHYSGHPDFETFAILKNLLEKYNK